MRFVFAEVEGIFQGAKVMYKKSFSQKAARVFEVAGFLLLIPTILGLFASVLLIFLLPIVMIPVILGVILLIGYSKHTRGTLDERKTIPLWIGTFVFNVLPLAVAFWQLLNKSNRDHNFDYVRDISFYVLFLILSLWWIVACSLSLTAIYSEVTNRFNYR